MVSFKVKWLGQEWTPFSLEWKSAPYHTDYLNLVRALSCSRTIPNRTGRTIPLGKTHSGRFPLKAIPTWDNSKLSGGEQLPPRTFPNWIFRQEVVNGLIAVGGHCRGKIIPVGTCSGRGSCPTKPPNNLLGVCTSADMLPSISPPVTSKVTESKSSSSGAVRFKKELKCYI